MGKKQGICTRKGRDDIAAKDDGDYNDRQCKSSVANPLRVFMTSKARQGMVIAKGA